jgi:hypothetical protein
VGSSGKNMKYTNAKGDSMANSNYQGRNPSKYFDEGCEALQKQDFSSVRYNFNKCMEIIREERQFWVTPNLNNIISELGRAFTPLLVAEKYEESKKLLEILHEFMVDYLGETDFLATLDQTINELNSFDQKSSRLNWEEKQDALIPIRIKIRNLTAINYPPYGE